MKLEVGKTYRTRDGKETHTIRYRSPTKKHPYSQGIVIGDKAGGYMSWTEKGFYISEGVEDPNDLVEEVVEEGQLTEQNDLVDNLKYNESGKIQSDGGPSSYYDFPPEWTTLNDYIESKSEHQWGADSFHLANITKAGCRWGDKDGTSKPYDAKKIVYSALRILKRLCGNEEVQKYLKELVEDEQFKGGGNSSNDLI